MEGRNRERRKAGGGEKVAGERELKSPEWS